MKIYNKENSKKEKIFFNEIFEDNTRFCKKINQIEYLNEGEIPIIDQGKSEIAGYSNLKENIYNDIPAIIFGDHTRSIKYIDFPFLIGADGVKVLKNKREDFLDKYLYYALKYFKIPNTGYNRHFKWLKEFSIYSLKIEEQNKIVRVLDNIQEIIKIKKEQLLQLNELSKSIFIEMFGDPIKNGKKWKLEKMLVVAPIQQSIKISKEMVWLLNLDGIESETGKIIKYEKKLCKEIEKNSIISFNEENVLYSKLRPYLNKVVIPEEEGYGTSELLPLKPDKNKIKRIFLANLLRTKSFVNYVNNKTIGAKMPRVSTKEIMNFNCIIPPIELQNSFAERIKMIEKSKVEIQKSIEETQKLFDSLMEKYFG